VVAPLFAPFVPGFSAAVMLLALGFQLHLLALIPGFFLRRYTWSWVVHPFLGILTLRDALMSDGTVRMLADHPSMPEAVVVMGRAHVGGYSANLIEQHGFVSVPFP
jgi:hypothetical protein